MSDLSKMPLKALMAELAKRTDDTRVIKNAKGNIQIKIASDISDSEDEKVRFLALKAKYEPETTQYNKPMLKYLVYFVLLFNFYAAPLSGTTGPPYYSYSKSAGNYY